MEENEKNNNIIVEKDIKDSNNNNNSNNLGDKEHNNIQEPFLNANVNLNNGEINNINNNIDKKNNNAIIGDYLVTIQYTKILHIPYFVFGNICNFYCPCKKFKSKAINLSQMPTPPFGIVVNDCK